MDIDLESSRGLALVHGCVFAHVCRCYLRLNKGGDGIGTSSWIGGSMHGYLELGSWRNQGYM